MYFDLLKKIWHLIYDPKQEPIAVVEEFFHPDYEQCVNGVYLDRAGYIEHVFELRKNVVVDSINYKHAVEKENELFTVYYPAGRDRNHFPIEAEVIAYFRFENKQIFRAHGQVQLIKGNFSGVDVESTEKKVLH